MEKISSPFFSIVSPVYNAEVIIPVFTHAVIQEIRKITKRFEIILIDDGSTDASWNEIKKASVNNNHIKGFRLSRNFGQQNAIAAGFQLCKGDFVVLMDSDMQDDPKYISRMYKCFDNATDYIVARKINRNQNSMRKFLTLQFYRFYNWIANNPMDSASCGFSILKRKVVDAYLRVNDYQKFYLPMLFWLGFEKKVFEVYQNQRLQGKSAYNFKKLSIYAFNTIISSSDKLLRISITVGFIFIFFSSILGIYMISDIVLRKNHYFVGWPSLFVLILFCTGIILFSLGIMSLYLAKIFEQVKQRPRFLIKETTE